MPLLPRRAAAVLGRAEPSDRAQAGRLLVPECEILLLANSLAPDLSGHILCPKHRNTEIPRGERLELPKALGVESVDNQPVGLDRPHDLYERFRLKAMGEKGFAEIPLEDLVTVESLDAWDLDALAPQIERLAISNVTRYDYPGSAELRLVDTRGEALKVYGPTIVRGGAVWLRFVEELDGAFTRLTCRRRRRSARPIGVVTSSGGRARSRGPRSLCHRRRDLAYVPLAVFQFVMVIAKVPPPPARGPPARPPVSGVTRELPGARPARDPSRRSMQPRRHLVQHASALGGGEGSRTPDLCRARAALYH